MEGGKSRGGMGTETLRHTGARDTKRGNGDYENGAAASRGPPPWVRRAGLEKSWRLSAPRRAAGALEGAHIPLGLARGSGLTLPASPGPAPRHVRAGRARRISGPRSPEGAGPAFGV